MRWATGHAIGSNSVYFAEGGRARGPNPMPSCPWAKGNAHAMPMPMGQRHGHDLFWHPAHARSACFGTQPRPQDVRHLLGWPLCARWGPRYANRLAYLGIRIQDVRAGLHILGSLVIFSSWGSTQDMRTGLHILEGRFSSPPKSCGPARVRLACAAGMRTAAPLILVHSGPLWAILGHSGLF